MLFGRTRLLLAIDAGGVQGARLESGLRGRELQPRHLPELFADAPSDHFKVHVCLSPAAMISRRARRPFSQSSQLIDSFIGIVGTPDLESFGLFID